MTLDSTSLQTDALATVFINRWQGVALTEATELSSQTLIIELCTLLDVDTSLPTDAADYIQAGRHLF